VSVRPIVVRKQDETQTVVKSGLEPNDRVVTTGFVRLTDGSKVSVGSADAATPAPGAQPPRGQRPDRQGGSERRQRGGSSTNPRQ